MAFQTFTATEYLKIDIASNFGLDKEDWDVRIQWFNKHEDQLEDLVAQAEEPALFYAGVNAYRQTQAGKPIGYPISLDATASGAQLLALLTGCEKSARFCNLIDTGHREDFYTRVYEAMQTRLIDAGEAIGTFSRQSLKDGVMPWFYGSEQQPQQVFGEGSRLDIFRVTMAEDTPGITDLRDGLISLWQYDVLSHDWIMPDGFSVKIKVMDAVQSDVQFMGKTHEITYNVNRQKERDVSLAANVIHAVDGMVVREVIRRCGYDNDAVINLIEALYEPHKATAAHKPSKRRTRLAEQLAERARKSGFLSAVALDVIDISTLHLFDRDMVIALIKSLPEKPFNVLSVHDCFRAHPNYGNDLRRQYNQVLYEMAKGTLLEDICSQIAREEVIAPKRGNIAEGILDANYALS